MNLNAIGSTWEDFKREHCTPKEIAASNLRVALMRELASVRKQKGFSQRSLGAATGISQPVIAKLEKGIDIGGFVTSPADVHLLKHDRNSTVAEIVIHEGKNRQVRRMFKAIGHPVLELCRTGLGNLEIGRLAVGQCRKLSPAEVEQLRRMS